VKRSALILAASLIAWCAPGASGATLVRDLGQGLTYFRVHILPGDIPSSLPGPASPCVLDLRYARSDTPAAAAMKAWIRFTASARDPVFVLENSDTSPSLLASIASGSAGVIVLAPESAKLSPDVAVRVAPDTDRRAYDALEKGAPVESLLSDFPDKPRVDEAYLEKEHIADSDSPDSASDKPDPPRPLVDAMLQRAVQLHRGLHALKKV
jgi:hypothetical protein